MIGDWPATGAVPVFIDGDNKLDLAGYTTFTLPQPGVRRSMNISCETDGLAGSVLLRALDPVCGVHLMAANRGLPAEAPPRLIASGPGRLCQALGLTRPIHNGLDITNPASPLQVRDDGHHAPLFVATPRIGIRHAVDLPLRFALRENGCVSGPKGLARVRNPKA